MKKIKISQVRSAIGRPESQRKTLAALGLRKLNNPVIRVANAPTLGMVEKVKHLLIVEEI